MKYTKCVEWGEPRGRFLAIASFVPVKNINRKNVLHSVDKVCNLLVLCNLSHDRIASRGINLKPGDFLEQSLDLCIRQAYHYLGQRRRGKFSDASQAAILKILDTIYGVKICRRTLNYHLRKLEDNDELKRIRRHKKGPYGRIHFHTTLVILKRKATEVLKRLARWFRKQGFNNWYMPSIRMDAPSSEQHAEMIMSFLKTTSQ